MLSLQLSQELAGRLDENAQTSEATDGRLHRRRIKTLLGRIHTDLFNEPIGQRAEQNFVQPQFDPASLNESTPR